MSEKFNFAMFEFLYRNWKRLLSWIFFADNFQFDPHFFRLFKQFVPLKTFFWQLDLDYEVSFSRIVPKRLCVPTFLFSRFIQYLLSGSLTTLAIEKTFFLKLIHMTFSTKFSFFENVFGPNTCWDTLCN